MRIIVAGSRTFTDAKLLTRKLDHITAKLDKKKITILSGHALGADRLAEAWAYKNWCTVECYHPDYTKYADNKKIAPLMRNQEMVDARAKVLVAFWDGESQGTKDIIQRARKKGLKVIIIRF